MLGKSHRRRQITIILECHRQLETIGWPLDTAIHVESLRRCKPIIVALEYKHITESNDLELLFGELLNGRFRQFEETRQARV